MTDRVVFVRPKSSELELCNVKKEPGLEIKPNLTGEEAKAFYDDLLGLPSTSYPKPDLETPIPRHEHRDSSDDEEPTMPEVRASYTKTLFSYAQNGENRPLKRMLLLKKLDVNMQDAHGWSPLHCAAVEGHISCIKTLLKFGASKDTKDNKGRTPLDLARKHRNHSAYHLIKHYGETEERHNQIDTPEPVIVTCTTCNTEYDSNKYQQHQSSIVHRASESVIKEPLYGIPRGNIGFRMLESMGWEEEKGLGPDGSGRKFPLKTSLKRDRQGLGLSAAKTRVTHFDAEDTLAIKLECEDRGEKRRRLQRKAIKEKTFEKDFRRAFH